MKKLIVGLLLILGGAAGVWAQGSIYNDIALRSTSSGLQTAPGASIMVCAANAAVTNGICGPAINIYTSAALSTLAANPVTADAFGNFSFYVTGGMYEITIFGNGLTPKTKNIQVGGSSTGGSSAGASGDVQINNGAGGFAAAGINDNGITVNVAEPTNINADFHAKGPNPSYDITRYGGYIGPNVWVGNGTGATTGTINGGNTALTVASALDFVNGNGVLVLGAGAAPTLSAPSIVSATATAVVGSTTRTYALLAEDWFGGRVPGTTTAATSTAVATQGVQTASLSSCNRTGGVSTCTTSSPHNFQAASQVNILRGSTNDTQFEGTFTIVSVGANTFTYNQIDVPDASGTLTHGSAQVGSRVILKWNPPASGDNTVLRTYIYMCTTTCALPANAANFTLEGVAIGNDGYFVDMGYSMGAVLGMNNGDVPATLPTTSSNRYLSTTITAGGGTTSLTLANAAISSVVGARVIHDNGPNILALCQSFPSNGGGHLAGTINIPVGTDPLFYFPIASNLDLTQCPSQLEIDLGTQAQFSGTLIPHSGMKLAGMTTGNRGQSTQFFNMNTNAAIYGQAYPLIYMSAGGSGANLSFEKLTILGSNTYQTLVYQDETTTAAGVTSLRFQDVHLNAGATNSAYVLKGGFTYLWERGGWGNSPADFNGPPSVLMTFNCGPGNAGQIMPSGLVGNNTYLFGGGLVVEMCGNGPGGGQAGVAQLINTLIEGSYVPVVKVNTGNYGFNLIATNVNYADLRSGSATPMFDFTNGNSSAVEVTNFGCATGYSSLFETVIAPTGSNQIQALGDQCAFFGAQGGIDDNTVNFQKQYKNYGLKLSGTGRMFAGSIASPGAPQSAVPGGAGSVPAGSHTYTFTAVDNDGFETLAGPGLVYVAADSVHTAVVTAPATFPAGSIGLLLYRDAALVNATFFGYVQVTVPGGTVTDLTSFGAGRSTPTVNRAGLYSVSKNGFNAALYRLNNEVFSAVPRAEQNVFLPGALTSTWTGSAWILDKAITVTRVMVQAKTAPAGCTPNAIVQVSDGSTPINVTITAAGNDSGVLTQNYAAGASIATAVQTAAAGCGTSPADANVTIQYKPQ
jgi:hypothetical protein